MESEYIKTKYEICKAIMNTLIAHFIDWFWYLGKSLQKNAELVAKLGKRSIH